MDKRPLTMVSTHARPVPQECKNVAVAWSVDEVKLDLCTSSNYIEYMMYTRGVDVADVLRGSDYIFSNICRLESLDSKIVLFLHNNYNRTIL